MKTYLVTTYNNTSEYVVSIDDDGVVDTDGLLPDGQAVLRFSVARHINRGLSSVQALQQAIGAYSYLTEVSSQDSL